MRRLEMAVENGAMHHVPTLRERTWRRLGFRYHLGDEPTGADAMPGWFTTTARFHFSFSDRLRLLLSGRLHVKIVGHADAKVDNVLNRMDWQIIAPGEQP
jgi:hypothetical protein